MRLIGRNQPCYIIAEIGINHNGDINIAKQLIDVACVAGCDAVKFQKRTILPEYFNKEIIDKIRETPWGDISYFEYKKKVEFNSNAYYVIDDYCKEKGIQWFASCWDIDAVDFMKQFNPDIYKIASPCITDLDLVRKIADQNKPVIMSTGMSTIQEIRTATDILKSGYMLMHCRSAYPARACDLNLCAINTLKAMFHVPVGYSGHETGLNTTMAAVAMGADLVERHITLDRSMWGSDQAFSIEPQGLIKLVKGIRHVEAAMGDGVIRVYDSEKKFIKRLRRVDVGEK